MTEIEMQGKLQIEIVRANNMGSGADCYVQVLIIKDALIGNKTKCALKTGKKSNTTDPEWNFSKTINLKGTYAGMVFRVKDSEFFKDQWLGEVQISAEEINAGGKSGTFECGDGTLTLNVTFSSENVWSEFSSTSASD